MEQVTQIFLARTCGVHRYAKCNFVYRRAKMQASDLFYDWSECGFELLLTVPLKTGVLIFHVEDPQTRLLLEMTFLTLAIDAFRKNIDKTNLRASINTS